MQRDSLTVPPCMTYTLVACVCLEKKKEESLKHEGKTGFICRQDHHVRNWRLALTAVGLGRADLRTEGG
ncbi:uncharacterized protein BO97DRAFT_402242 [Aspergillus homomorphus CBS 101889]|uniref:Uncharacterized protein n=1 Tax=Aspergillus homomorphus (strain CBS 101889) TaxID=1450537 RepID=A0A395ICL1_ASPHC|nr:hypothetical protein BO97DRAFT_402242 [Aspergillus homomorphus CBS 101889]RAL17735.1 hypothetical protein BO97DRAFT_402242 [Aspergillus homomorphus CBS 101889]